MSAAELIRQYPLLTIGDLPDFFEPFPSFEWLEEIRQIIPSPILFTTDPVLVSETERAT